jgi:hypothetical protein
MSHLGSGSVSGLRGIPPLPQEAEFDNANSLSMPWRRRLVSSARILSSVVSLPSSGIPGNDRLGGFLKGISCGAGAWLTISCGAETWLTAAGKTVEAHERIMLTGAMLAGDRSCLEQVDGPRNSTRVSQRSSKSS